MISTESNLSVNALKQFGVQAYAENVKDSKVQQFTTEELKFLIDSSIFGLFGLLEANKIKYVIKKDENTLNSKFIIKTYEKYMKKLLTSVELIHSVDHKIRIKIINF